VTGHAAAGYGLFSANAAFVPCNFTTQAFGLGAAPGTRGDETRSRPTEAQVANPSPTGGTVASRAGSDPEMPTPGRTGHRELHEQTSACDAIFADSEAW
jgi:hypothetical protein